MNRKWWSLFLRILPILFAVLAVSHPAFAHPHHHHFLPIDNDDPAAPELDPRLAIEGLAVASVAATLIWEKVRRRR